MKFNKNVVKFNIKNVNAIGNFENGGLIGLTKAGKELCEKIEMGVISEEEAMKMRRKGSTIRFIIIRLPMTAATDFCCFTKHK